MSLTLLLFVLGFLTLGPVILRMSASEGEPASPPIAKRVPSRRVFHGEVLDDPYHWLRDREAPEVMAYLEAENVYTDAATRPLRDLQETLFREVLGRIQQTDVEPPLRERDFLYYERTEEGKQYPLYCRKPMGPDAREEILLDANELAREHAHLEVIDRAVSDDGNLLAYTLDFTGYRDYELRVRDLRTGEDRPDRIPRVRNFAWAADGATLFYSAKNAAMRPDRVYRHTLGTDPANDVLVYQDPDEHFNVRVARSRDRKFVFLFSESGTTGEQWSIPADSAGAGPRVILPREEGHEYTADHRDGLYYIRTNKEAREFRLVAVPVDDPHLENGRELVGGRPDVTLLEVLLFRNHGVILGRAEGLHFLEVHDLRTGASHRVSYSEPYYTLTLDPDSNPEFDTAVVRFGYQSYVTPPSVFDYDMEARRATLVKRTAVLGGYDPARYHSERIFATALDGTRVPISLVSRATTPRDGTAPLFLQGYGAYSIVFSDVFNPAHLSLLDRGLIVAFAHVRGGGEYGQAWYHAGRLRQKRNSFLDFIACADHLVESRYTSRDRLVIGGQSAGGLLIAASLNLRPDLCRAAILDVPFVDVINSQSDPSLPLTTHEYLEWGNPAIREEYEYMRSYSPYENIAAAEYPAMLVRSALNDGQVPYWEPVKYVARMRATRTDRNRLLLKTNMTSGHAGASGRYDSLREAAFDFAFLLHQVGIDQ